MIGVLKQKKCRFCENKFQPKSSLQKVCSYLCALNLINKLRWKKDKKVLKEKLKTIGQYETEARKVFQMWIRKVRDKDNPCISCGTCKSLQFDAGHYFSANQFSALIFSEENVHKQCVTCNKHLHGNLLSYRDGLIKRYGVQYVSELELKKNSSRVFKYTKQQLIEIKNKYNELLKQIK